MQVIWFPPQPFESPGRFFVMTIQDVITEIERRLSFIHDALIGQSPEDLERHWRLMGANDAFNGLLKYIQDGNGTNIQD